MTQLARPMAIHLPILLNHHQPKVEQNRAGKRHSLTGKCSSPPKVITPSNQSQKLPLSHPPTLQYGRFDESVSLSVQEVPPALMAKIQSSQWTVLVGRGPTIRFFFDDTEVDLKKSTSISYGSFESLAETVALSPHFIWKFWLARRLLAPSVMFSWTYNGAA